MKVVKYLIIGAGISGLTFAAFKHSEDYLILEKDSCLGGLCKSFYNNGYVWDVAGHFFHFHSSKTRAYYEELMAGRVQRTVAKHAKVYYHGRYIDAPFQYNIHQLPPNEFVECLADLYYANANEQSISFADFIISKYGNGIASKFLIPYNEKLYACKMNDLEQNSMGDFLPKLDFDMLMSFFRGSKGHTYNDVFSYPINGCQEIVNALTEELEGERIHLNEEVISIDTERKIVTTSKDEYKYRYLINTTAITSFSKLIGMSDNGILKYNQVLVLNIGFDLPSVDKEISWAYYPGNEIFYRVGFYNNISGTNRLSIYVEISYGANDIINVSEALRKTLTDLKKVNVIDKHRMQAYQAYIINPGYVHITNDGTTYTEKLISLARKLDIYMVGRYAKWEYSAMDDSIEQAIALAKVI